MMEPELAYREWYKSRAENDFGLGAVQFVQVEPFIWVANMVAQHGTKSGSKGPPIRYDAVAECLTKVAEKVSELSASLHMPRIDVAWRGGSWVNYRASNY